MRGTPDDAGLIPLAVREIFALIEACQDREFLLRVSYMEVCVAGGGERGGEREGKGVEGARVGGRGLTCLPTSLPPQAPNSPPSWPPLAPANPYPNPALLCSFTTRRCTTCWRPSR